ncbi:MAG: cation diffusion facilitator family transporter [Anaeromyxobacter sp.]
MSEPAATARPSLTAFAWLSIAAALTTIALKMTAWRLTGSVGLLSDALESLVNLAAAVMTLLMLRLAERPEDEGHPFGHTKAEYLASATEGVLILVAAVAIAWTAVQRLLAPVPLEDVGLGLVVSTAASLVNLGVALVMLRAGKRYHSIALEADGHHLLTDVWTSVGVLAGIGLVGLTGWLRLDPIVAILVAANIVWTGVKLVGRSASGLLDPTLTPADDQALHAVLDRHAATSAVQFHAVRSRQAGTRRFVTMHVLVPGDWTVRQGHALLEEVERDVRAAIPHCHVLTHLEALDDPAAYEDQHLDR